MIRKHSKRLALFLILLTGFTGCHPTQPFYFHNDGDLSHLVNKSLQVEEPDTPTGWLADANETLAPLTLSRPEPQELWSLSLEDCVSITLQNTKLVRAGGVPRLQQGIISPGSGEGLLVNSPQVAVSRFDASIQESEVGATGDGRVFEGNVGTEAALAIFDAQFELLAGGRTGGATGQSDGLANAILNRQNDPLNVPPQSQSGAFFGRVRGTQTPGVTGLISKRLATGGRATLRHFIGFEKGNANGGTRADGVPTNQALASFWSTGIDFRMEHELLRGRGTLINRMPIILARMRTDDELANLETQLQKMLCNIEIRYWDLHCAFRQLETAKIGRDSALVTWKIVYEKWKQGVETVQAEAQSREQYFFFRSQVETALRDLYDAENELRLVMGIAATDGRLIQPSDEPTLAKVEFAWRDILCEGLARRPELRRQRWQIKRRENELLLAKNQLLPRLQVFGQYTFQGRGDHLINSDRNGIPFPNVGSTAYEVMTGGDFQEYVLGVDFIPPAFGARREMAGVRNVQLKLARDKARMEDMELDLSHGLSKSVRNLDANYQLMRTHLNRAAAAAEEVEAVEVLYLGGKITTDLVLEAFRRRANAQLNYYQVVCEYNKAIADIHCRKGSIMEYCNVAFDEGPWPKKAYWDAEQLARERDSSYYHQYGYTRPEVISRGPVDYKTEQFKGHQGPAADMQGTPELNPAPLPEGSRVEPQPADDNLELGPLTKRRGSFDWDLDMERGGRAQMANHEENLAPVVDGSQQRQKGVWANLNMGEEITDEVGSGVRHANYQE